MSPFHCNSGLLGVFSWDMSVLFSESRASEERCERRTRLVGGKSYLLTYDNLIQHLSPFEMTIPLDNVNEWRLSICFWQRRFGVKSLTRALERWTRRSFGLCSKILGICVAGRWIFSSCYVLGLGPTIADVVCFALKLGGSPF